MTNADKIRAMTDEEMAEWIADLFYGIECSNCPAYEPCVPTMEDMTCKDNILEWLQEEATTVRKSRTVQEEADDGN